MPKNKLVTVLIVVALFLLVPFLIGRITVAILNATYPSPSAPSQTANNSRTSAPGAGGRIAAMRAEAEAASQSLERARAITRIALVVIGVYYVALISALIIRSRKRRLKRA